MKTLHITAPNQNRRLGLILTGIMTAVICLLALLYDASSNDSEVEVPRLFETSKIVTNPFSAEVVSKVIVSAIWPF